MSRGILAAGPLTISSIEALFGWLAANKSIIHNPIISIMYESVEKAYKARVISGDHAEKVESALKSLIGGEYDLGEVLRATTLPLCNPVPEVDFEGKSFCLTGTFMHGTRKICETTTSEVGGEIHKRVSTSLNYLVIGTYVTESWRHSSFGNKIESAADYRSRGNPINIISEEVWSVACQQAMYRKISLAPYRSELR